MMLLGGESAAAPPVSPMLRDINLLPMSRETRYVVARIDEANPGPVVVQKP
jgi:hypothetical protein